MSRISSRIDVSGNVSQKPVSLVAPLRLSQITESEAGDVKALTRHLQVLQRNAAEATQAARSAPQKELYFENVPCGTAGAKTILHHGFDAYAYFQVVGWRTIRGAANTITAPVLVDDRNDASGAMTDTGTLSLRSYVAGEADLRVFA